MLNLQCTREIRRNEKHNCEAKEDELASHAKLKHSSESLAVLHATYTQFPEDSETDPELLEAGKFDDSPEITSAMSKEPEQPRKGRHRRSKRVRFSQFTSISPLAFGYQRLRGASQSYPGPLKSSRTLKKAIAWKLSSKKRDSGKHGLLGRESATAHKIVSEEFTPKRNGSPDGCMQIHRDFLDEPVQLTGMPVKHSPAVADLSSRTSSRNFGGDGDSKWKRAKELMKSLIAAGCGCLQNQRSKPEDWEILQEIDSSSSHSSQDVKHPTTALSTPTKCNARRRIITVDSGICKATASIITNSPSPAAGDNRISRNPKP
ncbi:unnamed protein product [Notodromas monacha]|uniref:Uncharacterized protein n=1 Tax=Notodromas monacha TaxID=399045 RepID=A0A7R9BLN7_9CRUS|nr:unnamed protein product [Notodromas monacha]CAG0917505.1 unnamed protein product [Notodromas monacha]